MAFIRSYSAQGDPFPFRTMRAGKLSHAGFAGLLVPQRQPLHQSWAIGGGRKSRAALAARRRLLAQYAGDPFSFRLPKAVRKLSLKKVVSAVGKVAKAALPIAAPFIPGVGPFLAPLLGASFAGGGSPESPAPELVQQPEYRGAISEVVSQYQVPGVEVSAQRDDGTYPGDYDESDYREPYYGPDDEDDELYEEED